MTAPDPRLDVIGDRLEAAKYHGAPAFMIPTQEVAYLLVELWKAHEALERVEGLHKPIAVYDECECPDGTHPDEYEWIDCEDYNGCENSFSHYACDNCCTANDYITEWCSDTHDHSSETGSQCPTAAAMAAAKGDER